MSRDGSWGPRTGSDAQLEWAIGNFLGYTQDQLTHLRPGSEAAALYVGRRLDQAWRALEWWAMQWFERDDTHLVLSRVHTPADAPLTAARGFSFDAIASPQEARGFLLHTRDALTQTKLDPVSVASGLFAARLSFSAYRLSKTGWLNTAGQRDHPIRVPAYQWWEA